MSFALDNKFGKEQEEKYFETIKTFFNDNIKTTSKYCRYDFEGETARYELKSRNVRYSHFETTLIPYDKIKDDKKLIFLFNFTDGLYYIEYNKEKFKSFKLDYFKRITRSDFNDKCKLYYFIPIEQLNKIC